MASAAGLAYSARPGPTAAGSSRASRAHDEVFDHTAAGYEKEIIAKTDGRGVDLVIEMLANVNLVRDLELIAKRGRVVIVGNRGALELNPRAIMGKDATVVGFTNWNATPAELATAHMRRSSPAWSDRDTSLRSARKCHWPMRRARTKKS